MGKRFESAGLRWRGLTPARALAAALLLAALASASVAQALPDVGEEQGGIADTPHSPRAKQPPSTVSFKQVAGARWQKGVPKPTNAALVEGSPTTVDVTFHAVSALDENIALAGGTIEQGGELRPTLYRFTTLDGWQPEISFKGAGFISSIAWLDENRALALGGNGTYPERERDDESSLCNPAGSPPEGDQAGAARAFLYTEGEGWRELRQLPDGDPQDGLPDSMSALTAAAAYLPPPTKAGDPTPPAFALAGGLCQIWHWSGAGFERGPDGAWASPNKMAPGNTPPRYRIRDISFAEPSAALPTPLDPADRRPRAYAVTSGCCVDSDDDAMAALHGAPETLTYTVPTGQTPDKGTWTKSVAESEPRLKRPDTHVSVTATQTAANSFVGPGVVTSPGGPYDENEPASHVAGKSTGTLSSVWLAAGDGDLGGATEKITRTCALHHFIPQGGIWDNPIASVGWTNSHETLGAECVVEAGGSFTGPPDGIADWSIGALTSSGRAIAYGTDPRQLPPPRRTVDELVVNRCKANLSDPVGPPDCQANSLLTPIGNGMQKGEPLTGANRVVPTLASSRLLVLSSYGLTAIDVMDGSGLGWAVGKYGSIFRFARDEGEIRKQEPKSQVVRASHASFSAREPWSSLRSPTTQNPGLIPPLAEQPTVELDYPEFVPAAGPVPTVMSEDGRYGWALRQRRLPYPLGYVWEPVAYLEDGVWHHCLDRLPSDPPLHSACASYERLKAQEIELNGSVKPALVPMRVDEDPTNDDEFELAALTTSTTRPLVRFRDGRWIVEPTEALGDLAGKDVWGDGDQGGVNNQIAFTAPDDGLVIAGATAANIYHFGGKGWNQCTTACDPNRLLPNQVGRVRPFCMECRRLSLVVADDLIFAYGVVHWSTGSRSRNYPYIVVRQRGELGFSAERPDAYYPARDPRFADTGAIDDSPVLSSRIPHNADSTGWVDRLVVARSPDGGINGLAVGQFQVGGVNRGGVGIENNGGTAYDTLKLQPDGSWTVEQSTGGALFEDRAPTTLPVPVGFPQAKASGIGSALVTAGDNPTAFVAVEKTLSSSIGPLAARIYRFDEERSRWTIAATRKHDPNTATFLSGDSEGGFYAEDTDIFNGSRGPHVLHYTDHPPMPVFSEVSRPALPPTPTGARIVQLTAANDGTIWAATDSEQLFRYERAVGWDRVRVPGWDPGRIVITPTPATALALTPQGSGLLVGRGGRIAQIEADGVQLDPASGRACDPRAPIPPCGTDSDLLTVAVAPDGSAVAAGGSRSLLWRPAGGEFRAIMPPPKVSSSSAFTSAAIRDESMLWVAVEGSLYRGELSGERFEWTLENEGPDGKLMAIERLALDASGQGFAVGGPRIYQRAPGNEPLWREIRNPTGEALTSIALTAGGGPAALIGGENGLILTWTGTRFEIARPAQSPLRGPRNGPIASMAIAPGIEAGQVEAWAITGLGTSGLLGGEFLPGASDPYAARTDTGQLLHFASDPKEPLLNPVRGVQALADSPAPQLGEISFAALGKSDCQVTGSEICTEISGSNEYTDRLMSEVIDEIAQGSDRGEIDFALWTGDAVDEGSYPGHQLAQSGAGITAGATPGQAVGTMGLKKLRRWGDSVPDRLTDRGVAMFGTPGTQDLSGIVECNYAGIGFPEWESCRHRKEVRTGENFAWRQAMAQRDAPWGTPGEAQAGDFVFERVNDGDLSVSGENHVVEADVPVNGKNGATIATGGAPTHYAIDVYENERDAVARLVFADTSQGSLAASDPLQQPYEPDGQAAWLERVLCFSPQFTPTGERCTREPEQRAIVVTNTPTYSYGPGALRETQPDLGVAFESILMRHDVDVVLSGRIGWNGRYWASAPGVHYPCPGAAYTDKPPTRAGACGQEAPGPAGGVPAFELDKVAGDSAGRLGDPLPFVVASGAGGKFADGQGAHQGDTEDGFWHGYSIVRLDPSGDPDKMIVEQRPVYDWVGIEASERILTAREKLRLQGFGRGPVGYNERGSAFSQVPLARYDRIDSAAITHRYDLLTADPQRPWVPLASSEGSCVPYACLAENVATIDRIRGEVRAGNGKYPDTFAIAMLSVSDHVASYPLLFRRSPSFVVQPLSVQPSLPAAPSSAGSAPAPPAPPNPPTPAVPQANVPTPPPVPPIAPLQAAEPPEPQPPVPPVPPPPSEAPAPLSLALAPPGITIATPTAVIQPPTPPVNPAPPGGARREARQRQAATQKSGADSDASEAGDNRGDQAQGLPGTGGAAFTRHDHSFVARERGRPEPSFTTIARESPSATGQALLYSGGITLLALAAAMGWTWGRPTPRRRTPEVPAPAQAWARARRR